MRTNSYYAFRSDKESGRKTLPGGIRISLGVPRWLAGGKYLPRVPVLMPQRAWLGLGVLSYRELFEEQLSLLNPERVWEHCHSLVEPHEPVLLCYERPPWTENNWCHRRMVAEWFEHELGETVHEGLSEQDMRGDYGVS